MGDPTSEVDSSFLPGGLRPERSRKRFYIKLLMLNLCSSGCV